MNRRTFTLGALGTGAAALVLPWEAVAGLVPRAGNPIFPGWYADPEARVFPDADGKPTYWIYPTFSAVYDQQLFLDAFSSPDHNGAQPIDPFVFEDPDGSVYLIYGGWRHCNIAKLNTDLTGFVPFADGSSFKEILQQDPAIATGAGHHSVLRAPVSGKYYIVYHRRPLDRTDRNHREVCIDVLKFDAAGAILPVKITHTGVAADPSRAS